MPDIAPNLTKLNLTKPNLTKPNLSRLGTCIAASLLFGVAGCPSATDVPLDSGRSADAGLAADAGAIDSGDRDAGADPTCRGAARDGDGCGCDADCVSGAACDSEVETGGLYPGGFCSHTCRPGMPEDCGEGICTGERRGTAGYCVPRCNQTPECGPGRICLGALGMCFPACYRHDHCDTGICNFWSGVCVTEEPTTGGTLLAPCASDADCRSDYCDTDAGRCVTVCPADIEGPTCPEDAHCARLGTDTQGLCFPRCSAESPCEVGTCRVDSNGVPVCIPTT